MHASVHEFFKNKTNRTIFKGKTILEVGALDINGTVRPFVESHDPTLYLATDFMAGPGVDQVVAAEKLVETFGKNSFDVVVSTEMLEHAENWRECINNMKDVTQEYLIITARGPGFPLHSYPDDWWRYTTEDMARIFADFTIIENMQDTDPQSPGVFFIGKKARRKRVDLSTIELEPAPKQ